MSESTAISRELHHSLGHDPGSYRTRILITIAPFTPSSGLDKLNPAHF
jgi:hypothetical protein